MKKKDLLVAGSIVIVSMLLGCGIYAYKQYSSYELIADTIEIELGTQINRDASAYIESNDKAIATTKLDFSNVDVMNVGTYNVFATYKNKNLKFTIKVVDTSAPTIKLANNGVYQMVEGQTLSADNIILSVEDLSGIASISFADASSVDVEQEDMIAAITLLYDKEGDYSNKVIVTDNNGNIKEKDISIHVIADYAQHISGFHDWTVEQNAEIDFTKDLQFDERISSVEIDKESIDVGTNGKYELTYNIAGDDNVTVIQEKVKVDVVDSSTAQELANSGNIVYISGNKKKEKVIATKTSASEEDNISDVSSSSVTPTGRAQRDAEARVVAQQIADSATGNTELERVESAMLMIYNNYTVNLTYSETAPYYNEPYGVFFDGYATCAGVTRAMGMVLECMGFQWSHAHENQYSHQWCELTMDGQAGYADASLGFAGYGEAIGELYY